MPKGKWNDNFLMNLHDSGVKKNYANKQVISESAQYYVDWYKIKMANRFSNRPAEYNRFTQLRAGSLARVTVSDKIFIFAHGSETHCGPYGAYDLAENLYNWGLRKAGLITFKACYLGKARFLKQFIDACSAFSIDVGWVKGYNGPAASGMKNFLGIPLGKPKETITELGVDDERTTILQGKYNLKQDIGRYVDPKKRHALVYEGD